jgi:ABC-type nitrate/sulfonate/bicarbonate transport system permease component
MSANWVGAAGVAVLVAVWWILAATAFRSSGAVPTPPAVLHQFAEDRWDFYWTNASVTLRGAAVGYLWGNLLALAVALVVLLLPFTEGVATQLAVISHCMPLTAIGPIILVVFGGRAPTIFPRCRCSSPLSSEPCSACGRRTRRLDVVTAYGGNRWHRLVKVQLIAALPAVLGALKIRGARGAVGRDHRRVPRRCRQWTRGGADRGAAAVCCAPHLGAGPALRPARGRGIRTAGARRQDRHAMGTRGAQ